MGVEITVFVLWLVFSGCVCTMSLQSNIRKCNQTNFIQNHTEAILSFGVFFPAVENVTMCSLNISESVLKLEQSSLFSRAKEHERLILTLQLVCNSSGMVILDPFHIPISGTVLWTLAFKRCKMLYTNVEQTFAQENYTIVQLNIPDSNVEMHDYENCTLLKQLITLFVSISFVKNCNITFNNASDLVLYHDKNETISNVIEAVQLQSYFPKVIILHTENIFIEGQYVFPVSNFVYSRNPLTETSAYSLTVTDGGFENLTINGPLEYLSFKKMSTLNITDRINFNDTSIDTIVVKEIMSLELDTLAFSGLKDVKHISFSKTNIEKVSKTINTFQTLQTLDLSDNYITGLEDGFFNNLTSIRKVKLDHNRIQYIRFGTFIPVLLTIREIDLSFNPLKVIPISPFYSPTMKVMRLRNTDIDEESINKALLSIHKDILSVFAGERYEIQEKLGEPIERAVLDFSTCKVRNLDFIRPETIETFREISIYFTVKLDGNALDCRCFNVNVITDDKKFIKEMKNATENNPILRDFSDTFSNVNWICQSPVQMQGRNVVSIQPKELFCPIDLLHCPSRCQCYERLHARPKSNIIDCSNTDMEYLPSLLNTGTPLELWFRNTSLKRIDPQNYLRSVIYFDASYNYISEINTSVLQELKHVDVLRLDSNVLQNIPHIIADINASMITLRNNSFRCDCTTGWMKKWLLQHEAVVGDWKDVMCVDNNENSVQLISVPDSMFACVLPWSVAQHVVMPSTILGSFVIVITVCSALIVIFRKTIKVLIFIRFGIHSFDRDTIRGCKYDVVVIYSKESKRIVENRIALPLKKRGYMLVDIFQHPIAGFSLFENVDRMISLSSRAIFFFSESELSDPLVRNAWRSAFKRAKETHMNFIILTGCPQIKKVINNVSSDFCFRSLLKSNNMNYTESSLFEAFISYAMPQKCLENRETEMVKLEGRVLFDAHTNDEEFVSENITGPLEEMGITTSLVDYEFIPGTDIRDEIFGVLYTARRLIFVLSPDTLKDEQLMYRLSIAITVALTRQDNFLLICTRSNLDFASRYLTSDVKTFLNNFVYLESEDKNLSHRLWEAITFSNETGVDEDRNIWHNGDNIWLIED